MKVKDDGEDFELRLRLNCGSLTSCGCFYGLQIINCSYNSRSFWDSRWVRWWRSDPRLSHYLIPTLAFFKVERHSEEEEVQQPQQAPAHGKQQSRKGDRLWFSPVWTEGRWRNLASTQNEPSAHHPAVWDHRSSLTRGGDSQHEKNPPQNQDKDAGKYQRGRNALKGTSATRMWRADLSKRQLIGPEAVPAQEVFQHLESDVGHLFGLWARLLPEE